MMMLIFRLLKEENNAAYRSVREFKNHKTYGGTDDGIGSFFEPVLV